MDDLGMEIEQRLTRVEERAKSNSHRLERLEPVVDEIHRISQTLVEMTVEMRHTKETVDEINEKVKHIEHEPGSRWRRVTEKVMDSVVTVVAGALAVGLVLLIAQYIH